MAQEVRRLWLAGLIGAVAGFFVAWVVQASPGDRTTVIDGLVSDIRSGRVILGSDPLAFSSQPKPTSVIVRQGSEDRELSLLVYAGCQRSVELFYVYQEPLPAKIFGARYCDDSKRVEEWLFVDTDLLAEYVRSPLLLPQHGP